MASPGLAGALGAFSQEAWARNAAAYETIRSMPFNAELAAGTLPQDRFRHYIVQDAHYLIGFGRALSLAAAKAPDPDTIVQFSRAAQEAIVVERALHGGFFRDYGIGPETFAATPLTPACDHYVCYLMATAYAEPYAALRGPVALLLDLQGGRRRHLRPRGARQPVPRLDRHLRRG